MEKPGFQFWLLTRLYQNLLELFLFHLEDGEHKIVLGASSLMPSYYIQTHGF